MQKDGQPQWVTLANLMKTHQAPRRVIQSLAEDGVIRTVKWGDERRGRRIYCVSDLSEALERLSVGKDPRIKRK